MGPDTSKGGGGRKKSPGRGCVHWGGDKLKLSALPAQGNTLPGPRILTSSDRGQHGDTPGLPDTEVSGGRPAGIASPSALSEVQPPSSTRGISVPNLPKLAQTAAVLLPPYAHLFEGPFPSGSPPPPPPGDSSFERACPGGGAASGTRASNLSPVLQSPGQNNRGEPRRSAWEARVSGGRVRRAQPSGDRGWEAQAAQRA